MRALGVPLGLGQHVLRPERELLRLDDADELAVDVEPVVRGPAVGLDLRLPIRTGRRLDAGGWFVPAERVELLVDALQASLLSDSVVTSSA